VSWVAARMSEPSVSSLAIYQLRVVLCGVSPRWRGGACSWSKKPVSANSMKSFRMPSIGAANICTAFLLLLFYLLKQQRSGSKFYSCAFVSIVLLIWCRRYNGFWHTFMHQKRSFSADVLPSHSLRRRKYQVIRSLYCPRIGLRPTAGCVVRVSP
jgi:hypothetical protein